MARWAIDGKPVENTSVPGWHSWRWKIVRDDGKARWVQVIFSEDVKRAAERAKWRKPHGLPPGIFSAWQFLGRPPVESFLHLDEPPALITVTPERITAAG